MFACACANVIPGFILPISQKDCASGFPNTSSSIHGCARFSIVSGIQRSGDSSSTVPKNSGAATPITEYTVPLNAIVLPTTPASRPNLRVQKAWLITATGCPPGVASSSGVKTLPAAGPTPSIEK